MGSEDASAEGFKVRDRRGQGADSEPPRPPRAGSAPEADKPRRSPESAGDAASGPFDLRAEPDLASLFLLLANSALLHLGEASDTSTTEAPVDLAQAKLSIDLLRLLKAKTEGHRTPEETRLLERILYDLQMRFVQTVRRS